jgi:hypothetical protein
MFCKGKIERHLRLARRAWSISIGHRPMRADRHINARLKALKPFDMMLTPFQGLLFTRFRFIGCCPMLLLQGLRPYPHKTLLNQK